MRERIVIISIGVVIAIVLIVGLLGYGTWYTLFRISPGPFEGRDVSDADYFKYGSIGMEPTAGVPYWIWVGLPEIFPEHLPGPGGYAALGLVREEGQETPIGFSKQEIGIVPRIGINCAVCHTSVYRQSAAETGPTIVRGGASQGFNVLGYQRFLFDAAGDPKFSADILIEEIDQANPDFSWFGKWLYRFIIIPRTRDALLETRKDWEWTYNNPEWEPGRIDPFNPVKFGILEQPVDDTIGNSDMLSIWNMKLRDGMA